MSRLKRVPIKKDGNCFFHSIAINMTSNKDRWNNCLSRLGVVGDTVVGDTDIGTLSFVKYLLTKF